MTGFGNFAFGGQQRSLSYACFHADKIPNSIIAVVCPAVTCAAVMVQNDPDSTGDALIGSVRLGVTGGGQVLQPGEWSGWIPVTNLNKLWHKELDAATTLNYMLLGCLLSSPIAFVAHLLLEAGGHVLLEDGELILL